MTRLIAVIECGGTYGFIGSGECAALPHLRGKFDAIVGTSSGILIGLCAEFGLMRDELHFAAIAHDLLARRPISFKNLARGRPILCVDAALELIEDRCGRSLPEMIRREEICDLYVTAVNITMGKTELFRLTPDNAIDLIRATCAIPVPFVARKVRIGENFYVDGGTGYQINIELALSSLRPDRAVLLRWMPEGRKRDSLPRWLGWLLFPHRAQLRKLLQAQIPNYARELAVIREAGDALCVIAPSAGTRLPTPIPLEWRHKRLVELFRIGMRAGLAHAHACTWCATPAAAPTLS